MEDNTSPYCTELYSNKWQSRYAEIIPEVIVANKIKPTRSTEDFVKQIKEMKFNAET